MKKCYRTAAMLILAMAGISVGALAATIPGTMPATAPAATSPASQPAVDRSTPEKTWASICVALKENDLPKFRAAFYNRNALAQEFMETYSDITLTTFDLARATSLLGEEGKAMAKEFAGVYDETVKSGENRKLEVTGDTAKWTHAEKPAKGVPDDVICFRKVKGEWLIDTVETYELDSDAGRAGAEKLIASVPKVTVILKQVAADIRAKKITTVAQMRDRLNTAK